MAPFSRYREYLPFPAIDSGKWKGFAKRSRLNHTLKHFEFLTGHTKHNFPRAFQFKDLSDILLLAIEGVLKVL